MNKKKAGGVIELQVEDYKKVKKLHVVLVTGINEITGPNGAGKSSVLDTLSNIFGGKRLTPLKPIREGAEGYKLQATIEKLGLKLTRTGTLREDGTLKEELIVENAEGVAAGAALGRPQELLDKLMGGHSIVLEPLMEMSTAGRLAVMRDVTGLDFTKLDTERDAVFAKRTTVNGATKALASRYEGMHVYPDAPKEPVSVKDLMAELDHRLDTNKIHSIRRDGLKEEKEQILNIESERDRVLEQISELEKLAKEKTKILDERISYSKKLSKEVDGFVDCDVDEIRSQISEADGVNLKVRANADYAEVQAEHAKSAAHGNELTKRLKAIDKEKSDALAAAKFPVKGLSFDSNEVYLNGIPLEQASQVELINVDIAIALTQSPGIPLILINNGSLYDKEHREELDRIAKEHSVFIPFERVLDSRADAERQGVAVYMEDGVGIVTKGGK